MKYKPETVQKKTRLLIRRILASDKTVILFEKQPDKIDCEICGNITGVGDFSTCFCVVPKMDKRDWYYERLCMQCTDNVNDKIYAHLCKQKVEEMRRPLVEFMERLRKLRQISNEAYSGRKLTAHKL